MAGVATWAGKNYYSTSKKCYFQKVIFYMCEYLFNIFIGDFFIYENIKFPSKLIYYNKD